MTLERGNDLGINDTNAGGNRMTLKVKRLTETARLPERNNDTDAGFDIFSTEDIEIYNTGNKAPAIPVSTGIAIEIPEGYYGRLKGRSGNTIKTALRVHEGTIDSGYRGELKVMCSFTGDGGVIRKEDKIAQLIIQELPKFEVVEVEELTGSQRGELGFGSSGTIK